MSNNFSIPDLLKLVERIEWVNNDPAKIPFLKDDNKKAEPKEKKQLTKEEQEQLKEQAKNKVQFSPAEKELMLKHKEFFKENGYSKILGFIEDQDGPNTTPQIKTSVKTDKEKLTNFLQTLITFTNEKNAFPDYELKSAIDKLYKLCGNEQHPEKTLKNTIELIKQHTDSQAKQPIHDLCLFNPSFSYGWNNQEWFKLALKSNKKVLKLLSRADVIEQELGKVPSSYEEALKTAIKVGYKRSKEIELVDETKLSPAVNKDELKKFTEICLIQGITEEDYNKGLNVLLDPDLKTKDNLPDFIIDGETLGKEFPKCYMAKLPAGDYRGLVLGELTNCCQSIGNNAEAAAIDGMTNNNTGFYAIFEKGKGGKIDIDNDRIIGQSYAWLGKSTRKGGKTLVFDSWERLGINNDKLLDPFYSKFAAIVGNEHNISKVSIGTGGNTPKTIAFRKDETPTKFNGTVPYGDANKQYIILDKEKGFSPYDKETEQRRLDICLLNATQENNLNKMNYFLDRGANLQAKNHNGMTALILAAQEGHIEAMKLLIDKKADVNVKDNIGATALMLAAQNVHIEAMKVLIENDADVNAESEDKYTALMKAAQKGHIEAMKLLIDKKADVNAKAKNKATALILAAEGGYAEAVKLLIEKKADVNVAAYNGTTALMGATIKGNIESIKLLIENGADVDAKNSYNNTALILAAQKGHIEAMKLLIDKKADVNEKSDDNMTALMFAAKNGHVEAVKLLIEKKADVNAKTNYGSTALMLAARNGQIEAMKLLIENGADVNEKTKDNTTALMLAVQNGKTETVKFLIENGADINAKNNNGYTALMGAVEKGNTDIIKLLIENGADINAKNNNGYTALMGAVEKGNTDIIKLLIENGADVNAKSNSSRKVSGYAKNNETKELLKNYKAKVKEIKTKLNTKVETRIEAALKDLAEDSHFQDILKKHRLVKYVDSDSKTERSFKEQAKKLKENITAGVDKSLFKEIEDSEKYNKKVNSKVTKQYKNNNDNSSKSR
jgi:ankyrin repeat protein